MPEQAPRPRGSAGWAAAAALAVAAATLFPTGDTVPGPLELCLLCGERGLADALLNVGLFVPLGAALAWRGLSGGRALLLGAALSAAIEVAQHFVPGRDPSPADILFNSLGAALGWALVRSAPGWLDPPPRRARRLLAAGVAFPLLVVLVGGLLLAPGLPRSVYHGQWTADLGYLEWYRGRVLAAWVGEVPVPSRRMERESPRLRALLEQGAAVRVEARAGPPPPALAPVFSVYDHLRREVVLLGVDGEDAVYRYRTRGTALKTDQPDLRFPGALRGVRPGDPLRMSVERGEGGWCIEVNAARRCGLGFAATDTWSVLLFPSRLTSPGRTLLGLAWLAGLCVPAGLWLRGRRQALAATAALAAGLLLLPPVVGLLPTSPAAIAAAIAGLGVGVVARSVVFRHLLR